jgi:nitric oxide synthase-interacting protein
VACSRNGDLFCRECAINDLLAQRKEIQRLEREREFVKVRREEDEERGLEELREKEVRDFELVSMGLEATGNKKRKVGEQPERQDEEKGHEVDINGKRRRVFELGEAELSQLARSEQEKLRKEIERQKVRVAVP